MSEAEEEIERAEIYDDPFESHDDEDILDSERSPEPCPECHGLTVQFKGKGLDLQYRICSRYQEAGHLNGREINNAILQRRQAARPSGRFA